MITDKEREQRAQDIAWSLALLANSPALPAFQRLRSRRRGIAYHNLPLAVWEILDGQVVLKSRYSIRSVTCSQHAGFQLEIFDEGTENTLSIGHLPVRLPGTDCFLWVPRFTDARFTPANVQDAHSAGRLSFGIMFGSIGRIDRLEEGVEYLGYYRDLADIQQQLDNKRCAEVANA